MIDNAIFQYLKDEQKLADFRTDRFEADDITAKILDFNEEFVVLHRVAKDSILYDGLAILATRDISFIRWDDRRLSAYATVLEHERVADHFPTLSLDSWKTIIQSLANDQNLMVIHRQYVDDAGVYIGYIYKVYEDAILMQQVTPEADIEGMMALELEEITKIEAFGRYETDLEHILRIRQFGLK
jgi:hypothetical protein